MAIKTINPNDISVPERMAIITGAVAPRPIAFAGTIDKDGKPNLAPFSFYNAFGANPPIMIFSPARRGRDNTVKDTYLNIREIPEVVINVVNYPMVEQMNLASAEYPKGVSEYEKAGFTAVKSEKVKPFRVKESPVQFECKVVDIIETGDKGGAGMLVIAEILLIHINEEILDEAGKISPNKIDLVGRLGADYYCRLTADSIFTIEKPLSKLGIGFDNLPENIKQSTILSANDVAKLAGLLSLPDDRQVADLLKYKEFEEVEYLDEQQKHLLAKKLLAENHREEALKVLMT